MSRREFRGAVESPRPSAAWLMSITASTTLWVTEQLPLWVIAVQCFTVVCAFATRSNPPAFRRSPIWLNLFMAGITTITVRSALSGNPATLSLAQFTALAQALQLLDTRPRKSEFVLVALSLFQVILASTLTDSIFFPPLLLLFLATVTWTLIVHTLQIEATEAGDPAAASRAIAPDLRRMTVISTSACLILAMLIFITLPRLGAGMRRGARSPGISISGFSDRVSLGDVGRIRKDESVVLRVEGSEGELPDPVDAYWRGLAFDEFDGRSWSISRSGREAPRRAISGVGRLGIDLDPVGDAPLVGQRILREPVEHGVVFAPGPVQRIEGPFQHLERDRNGGLYLPGRSNERVRYTIWSQASERDAVRLRSDRAQPPLEPNPGGVRAATRYLQLPDLDPRIHARAREIVADAATDFERAYRIQERLREEGRYTDAPPALGDEQTAPIEAFVLGNLEGHCEYFASAMVVLARSQGLPSRLVNGFAGGVPNDVGGFIEVTRADAHAWVEVHFAQAGWVRFDPTPPLLRLRAGEALSPWQRLAQLGSALELWWFQRVVDYDSADQIGAMRSLWSAWNERDPDRSSGPANERGFEWSNPLAGNRIVVLVLGVLIAGGLIFLRRTRADDVFSVPEGYRRAQHLLAKRGWVRADTTSARDFARKVGRALDPPGAAAFASITARYLAERFGAEPPSDVDAELAALQNAVDRMGLRDQTDIR